MAPASAAASAGGTSRPFSPSRMISGVPPTVVPTTGVPTASACGITCEIASDLMEGRTRMSSAAITWDVAAEARHDDVGLETHLAHAETHVLEADAVADDEKSRPGHRAQHRLGGLQEVAVTFGAAHVGDQADHRAGEPQLVAHRLARHAGVEARRVHPRGDGDDPL